LPADDAECVVRPTDITIRRTISDDLDDIGRIYTHHVQTGVATFELVAPDRTDIGMRDASNRVILIGKKAEGFRQAVSLFSLIFTVFSFLLLIFAGLNAAT